MAVHQAVPGEHPNPYWPPVYCGSTGSVLFTRKPKEVTCVKCIAARTNEVADEKRPLGLFAVFYDGETRPVAGFVLEQDAEEYARKHAGEATWEIRHVNIVEG